jgi:thiamine pyrophosphate-dependent acetolactate synthase large subunit-like protein
MARTAISGLPGPVYLEIPVDVLGGKTDEKEIKRFSS